MENSNYPTSNDMPNEQATWLFETCSILIVLDLPVGSEFGIDCNSWDIGKKFRGIKMIPPGFHYIYYCSQSKDGKASRVGTMKFFQPKEFIVTKWNSKEEILVVLPDSCDDVERLKENKQELDAYLGAYPYESLKKWVSLTNHITHDSVERIKPLCGIVFSAPLLKSESSTTESRQQAKNKNPNPNALPDLKTVPGTELRLLPIPKRCFKNMTGAEITQAAMDDSHLLTKLFVSIDQPNKQEVIMAELQLTFVCFLIGQQFDAFEQWKVLVGLLCNCVTAIEELPELFHQFIGVLHYNIQEFPEDFFYDIITQENFLVNSLAEFFLNVETSDCEDGLKIKASKFRSYLEKKFAWSFETEDPVVVDCEFD